MQLHFVFLLQHHQAQPALSTMSVTYVTAAGTRKADFTDCFALVLGSSLVRFRDNQELARRLFEFLAEPRTVAQVAGGVPGLQDPERLLRSLANTGVVTASSPLIGQIRQLDFGSGRAARELCLDAPEQLLDQQTCSGFARTGNSPTLPAVLVRESVSGMLQAAKRYWDSGLCHVPLLPSDGEKIVIGPAVVPGITACFECLLVRRAALTEWPDEYLLLNSADAVREFDRADLLLGLNLARRLADSAFYQQRGESIGACLVFTPDSLTAYCSRVWSVPRCPTCSKSGIFSTNYPWLPSPS